MSNYPNLQKTFQDLLSDLDIPNSTINQYLDSLILSVILRNLDIAQRREFMKKIINLDSDSLMDFVTTHIPDFEHILKLEIQKDLRLNADETQDYG